jgi:2-methylisocitrate lyase-like PEP mutase family enzyme
VKAGADLIFADAVKTEDQIKRLVEAVDVPVSVNMGFGLRSRPTTPLIPIARLAQLGVKRVTLPRMLPAAAILAMRKALAVLNDNRTEINPAERPDLLTDIDDIWALMGEADVEALESRYMELDSVEY